MPRSLLLVVPLVLFAACATPRPVPLPLGEAFAIQYTGSIAPAVPCAAASSFAAPAAGEASAAVGAQLADLPTAAAAVRAWLVRLPLAEARAALAEWTPGAEAGVFGFGVGGHHVDRLRLVAQIGAWHDRGAVLAQPFLVTKLGQKGTMRMTTESSAIAGFALRSGVSALMLDPDVKRFEHGTELQFTAARRGEETVVTIDWRHSELLQPGPVTSIHGGQLGSMAVPITLQHRFVGETKVAPRDAVVLGVVPTATPDAVMLLCLETETEGNRPDEAVAASGGTGQ
jgi:hypothetical protein